MHEHMGLTTMIDLPTLRAMVAAGASASELLAEVEAQTRERARAHRLPVDWSVSDRGRLFAQSRGFDEWQIEEQAQRFRDHALATGRRQVDWEAAWRNWVTSPYQSVRRLSVQPAAALTPRQERQEETYRVARKVREYAQPNRRADGPAGGGAPDDAADGELPLVKHARS